MQRKPIIGHFTKIVDSNHIGVSEDEAKRLLHNHCRNVDEQIASLKGNPFGQEPCEGGLIRYEVHRAPVVTVPDGGPVLRGLHLSTPKEQVEFLLDLVADHAPVHYDGYFDKYQEIEPAGLDAFAAQLMEVLDNVAGPDITFTVRPYGDDAFMTLGFWKSEPEEN